MFLKHTNLLQQLARAAQRDLLGAVLRPRARASVTQHRAFVATLHDFWAAVLTRQLCGPFLLRHTLQLMTREIELQGRAVARHLGEHRAHCTGLCVACAPTRVRAPGWPWLCAWCFTPPACLVDFDVWVRPWQRTRTRHMAGSPADVTPAGQRAAALDAAVVRPRLVTGHLQLAMPAHARQRDGRRAGRARGGRDRPHQRQLNLLLLRGLCRRLRNRRADVMAFRKAQMPALAQRLAAHLRAAWAQVRMAAVVQLLGVSAVRRDAAQLVAPRGARVALTAAGDLHGGLATSAFDGDGDGARVAGPSVAAGFAAVALAWQSSPADFVTRRAVLSIAAFFAALVAPAVALLCAAPLAGNGLAAWHLLRMVKGNLVVC